ncbi:MAG TPA: patatin-like phospholipase family protein [Thermoleophilaceae bacterium]|nr:patatin-like phospholipase family protein [Thermoleophilaceae bacterium]
MDVLVLGGGGILGEAWMSALLAGLADSRGVDARESEAFVGTSAGSIVAAALAAGVEPHARLGELPEQPAVPDAAGDEPDGGSDLLRLAALAGRTAAAPFAALGLRAGEPGGALLRRLALSRVPDGRRSLGGLGSNVEKAGVRWDGRLRISAVDAGNGKRVMFGSPGAPKPSVGQAVEASCAIPGVFRPIVVDGRSYVDGGAWSPTNMDAAPVSQGARLLCLNPTGSLRLPLTTPFGALAMVSRSLAAVEQLALERRGVKVQLVVPDEATVSAIGPSLMDPSRREAVIATGLAQGRALKV